MPCLPRIALGTIQSEASSEPVVWALLDVLEQSGLVVQPFLSQARFAAHDGAAAITGQGHRHLDSWLMSPSLCREVFQHGMRYVDLGLVEGRFTVSGAAVPPVGGNLDMLCDWLDLPRIAILDVAKLGACLMPPPPDRVDAVLLDGVASPREYCAWQTLVESLWRVPVWGGLGEIPQLRAAIRNLPAGARPPRELCRALGESLVRNLRVEPLVRLAQRNEMSAVTPQVFSRGAAGAGLHVAVAYDEAFYCYFPDVLDLLELQGATVRTFSPLRDEKIPTDTDLVYFGCGHAERHAGALAANHCMLMALRNYAQQGGRIYAEGSGQAYLCRQMIMADGFPLQMAGILPAVARVNPCLQSPQPVELTLARDSWLGRSGARLRGYRNVNWQIEPIGPINCHVKSPNHFDLLGQQQALGSRVHLNFAAQPDFLRRFFLPRVAMAASAHR